MLSRRRVFAVERLGNRDGAFEDLAQGCVVPGVICTYRRIPDKTHGCSPDFGEGQMPLLKLASQDSGMEMVVGDSPLATLSGLSQDSLNLEPMGSPELPSAQLDRLLARRKLDQVLERSLEFPSLSGQRRPMQLLSKPVGGVPIFAGELESTEADTELEAGLEEAKVVGDMESGALTCLPGQGLRYLEHLCLVLEQMARLQQLYLQLQTQRPSRDPEEEELALALSSSSHTPDNRVQGHREQPNRTRDPGDVVLFLKVQRQLHSQRWGCQRPCWTQPTPFHARRDTRISPTGTRSRCCSTASVGGALDSLSLLLLLMVLDPGWSSGTCLKGFNATPTGRPLYQHWWLRNHEQKTFLYDLLACLVTLGGRDLP
ncbi:uncharacterized protein C8orf58 homolog isoform X2 [Mesocricetus auratus]|uniref:Uncharacterized protein C8orf58 homolog isoform X2 n=1 Tax=Mesocricetus auratus TaxID=10036 RepID=A0A3Q0CLA3_MESAU|nr:uncharacterized protein C8orf58 homolog isoform X2 [Mesocricetus auratus]